MDPSPLFFRIRLITFTSIMLFSFLWLVLLCVEMFTRWGISDQISHSLMFVFVLANTTTLVSLPILILVQFRVWLDTARLFFLFVMQVGSAVAGSIWSPRIQCPHQTPDDLGVCQLIGIYTLIACWIIPAILASYSTYFAVVVCLQSRTLVVMEPEPHKPRLEMNLGAGRTNSLSSWHEAMKEIIRSHTSAIDTDVVSPRQLLLPTMVHTRQSEGQSTLSNVPRRQSTPPLPHTSRQYIPGLPPVPSRHHSLPAFKHGHGPPLHPLLIPSMPHLTTSSPSSHPQTPSSHSYSIPSSANPQNERFICKPSIADVQSPENPGCLSKHLSMPPSSSCHREMQCVEGSPTARSARAKLSKPLPIHLM